MDKEAIRERHLTRERGGGDIGGTAIEEGEREGDRGGTAIEEGEREGGGDRGSGDQSEGESAQRQAAQEAQMTR